MSQWIQNKKPYYKDIIKPCKSCGYCPYGSLVEEYPLHNPLNKMSCEIFGHDCPAFYQAELFAEDSNITAEEETKQNEEFQEIIDKMKEDS